MLSPGTPWPFEQIRRVNDAGNPHWSSRDFARILGYVNYRHFLAVMGKARTECFNSGQRVDDHFVGINDMVTIGGGTTGNAAGQDHAVAEGALGKNFGN